VEPRRVNDHNTVRCRRHDARQPEIAKDAGHDLSDRSDRIGKLLLRHPCHQAALGTLLRGGQIQQMPSHPLLHRTKGVDRRLLQRLVQPPVGRR
jgi:hypothetical protein